MLLGISKKELEPAAEMIISGQMGNMGTGKDYVRRSKSGFQDIPGRR